MGRIIHFDLCAADVDRAIKFYKTAFGWKFDKWDGPMEYWLITTGEESEPGIDGGLSKGDSRFENGELTLSVDSLEEAVKKVDIAGGKITRERSAIGGIGLLAIVADTEGNTFGLMESDPQAK